MQWGNGKYSSESLMVEHSEADVLSKRLLSWDQSHISSTPATYQSQNVCPVQAISWPSPTGSFENSTFIYLFNIEILTRILLVVILIIPLLLEQLFLKPEWYQAEVNVAIPLRNVVIVFPKRGRTDANFVPSSNLYCQLLDESANAFFLSSFS